jgi:predicted component of type VI protein secretion system
MKRASAAFALTALVTATIGLAQQQTTPQPQAQPPASTAQSQTPSDPKADKQALLKDCVSQVGAANPRVPEKEIRDFCTKELDAHYSPHD